MSASLPCDDGAMWLHVGEILRDDVSVMSDDLDDLIGTGGERVWDDLTDEEKELEREDDRQSKIEIESAGAT